MDRVLASADGGSPRSCAQGFAKLRRPQQDALQPSRTRSEPACELMLECASSVAMIAFISEFFTDTGSCGNQQLGVLVAQPLPGVHQEFFRLVQT